MLDPMANSAKKFPIARRVAIFADPEGFARALEASDGRNVYLNLANKGEPTFDIYSFSGGFDHQFGMPLQAQKSEIVDGSALSDAMAEYCIVRKCR
jgi:hypothetical protein